MAKTVRFEINVIAWTLFTVGLSIRLFRLDHPRAVVFDELHYAKFVSMYIRGIFFFDTQPPLGKQLVSLAAYFAGYDGNATFTAIGSPFDPQTPVKALRLMPVLFGSLIVPVLYHLALNIGLTEKTAIITCLLYLLENTFLTQSRFLLMDSMQMFFSLTGLLFTLKARNEKPLSFPWTLSLLASSIFLSLGICVKFVGLYTLFASVILVLYDFWWLIPNEKIESVKLWIMSGVYFVAYTLIPIIVYIFIFWIHLSFLTRAGPHDNILTSAFQASLEGGLASITKGQPLEVVHGSQVTLRHSHGRTCWLHSHQQVYPVKYSDARGSSHQQQVTCYSFKDVNNWWIIKKPKYDDVVVYEPLERIVDGDVIQIVHGMTGRLLNSHDVAAPMSPQHQEVSCYIDYNISMPSQNLWKVHLINSEETGGVWHTIRSLVHLIHVNSSQALKFSGKQLPDWGFNQHEVVTDRLLDQEDTVWNVEEHRYTKETEQKDRERDMIKAEFVPLTPTRLGFWAKMKELQYKMLFGNNDRIEGHTYENQSPLDWLFLSQGIAYWVDSNSNSQVHLLGNLCLWLTSLVAMFTSILFFIFFLLRRRRQFFDLNESQWNHFSSVFRICLIGFLANFLPYFFVERTLFLYYYLPCLYFQHLFLSSLVEFTESWLTSYPRIKLILFIGQILFFILFLYNFIVFLPVSFGSGNLTAADVEKMRWKPSWLFIIHKK